MRNPHQQRLARPLDTLQRIYCSILLRERPQKRFPNSASFLVRVVVISLGSVSRMRFFFVIFLSAATFFAARADSRIHPRSVPGEVMKMMNVKRQTPEEMDMCVEEKLEKALISSECNSTFVEAYILSLSDDYDDSDDDTFDAQVGFNIAFGLFCTPECGNVIIQVNEDCGAFDESPGLKDLLIGVCSINAKDQPCYNFFFDFIAFFNETELECYVLSKLKESCDCKGELSPVVDELGCCITVYHDAFRAVAEEADLGFPYKPEELYTEYCDVDLPRGCNNSPLSGSLGIHYTLFAIVAATLLAIFA